MSSLTIEKIHPQYITDEQGRRKVLLSVEEYEALAEAWEDYMDARDAEAAIEAGGESIPYEKFVEELKRDGLLK